MHLLLALLLVYPVLDLSYCRVFFLATQVRLIGLID